MQLRTLLLSGALLLGACTPATLWTKPDITAEGWRQDQYTCERDMRMSSASFGHSYVREYYAKQFYARCLESKGYSRRQ